MTDFAYHRDCYLTELDAEVVSVGEDNGRPFAVLSDTLFYPEGGGQPADRGTLGGVEVLDVQKGPEGIRHFLTEAVEPGPARLELDWSRRYDHMQQHTAQHVLTATALTRFGWRTTVFHLGPESSDIELDAPSLSRADLDRLERAVAAELAAARPISYLSAEVSDFERLGVRSRALPEGFEGTVRLVDIEGLDLNTCGGTHVRSTAEIGLLALLGTEPMRGGTRVFFIAGDRVLRRLAGHEQRMARLRSLLDTGDEDLADVVALRLEREKQLARTVRRLTDELADVLAENMLIENEPVIDAHWDEHDMAFLQRLTRRLAEHAPATRALLTAGVADCLVFAVVAGPDSGLDLAVVGPRVAAALEGRGGGRSPIFQGKAGTLARRDAAIDLLRS